MEKQELINQIREILPVMDKLEKYMSNMSSYQDRISHLENVTNGKKPFVFMTDAAIGIVFGGFIWMSVKDSLEKLIGGWSVFILLIILAGIGAAVNMKAVNYLWGLTKTGEKKELEKCKISLKETEQAMIAELSPHWGKVLSVVPEDYATPLCVQRIYSYLVNGRADDLKESLNLFEEEQHRWRMEEGQRQMYEQYQYELQNIKEMQAEMNVRITNAEMAANSAFAVAASQSH